MKAPLDSDMYSILGMDEVEPNLNQPTLISQNRLSVSRLGRLNKLSTDSGEILVPDASVTQDLTSRVQVLEMNNRELRQRINSQNQKIASLVNSLEELRRAVRSITGNE